MFALFETFQEELAALDQDVEARERIDRIRRFEQMEAALSAARAREVAAFARSQRNDRSASAQVGLARRMSPFAAARYVKRTLTLTTDLPQTFARLGAGEVSEHRALLVAKEAGWLAPEHRAEIDAQIAPRLERLGTRRLVDQVKHLAYRLDPQGYLKRIHIAENERHVSVRPVADGMARFSVTAPLPQCVAAYASVRNRAASQVGIGTETRSQSQLMTDAAIERLTGQSSAAAVPIQVNVVMTDQTLLNHGDGDEPAQIVGGGAIPAELARRMLTGPAAVLLRKLYVDPAGRLAAMESRSRLFTEAQRTMLILRDQTCRMPWCDAPIRHADHVIPHDSGGPTAIDNGQGLCESCNYTKANEGWVQYRRGEAIITVTPTGHLYRSTEPRLPGSERRPEELGRSHDARRDDLDDDPGWVDPRLSIAS